MTKGNAWIFEEKSTTGQIERRVLYGSVSAMLLTEQITVGTKVVKPNTMRMKLRQGNNVYCDLRYHIEKLEIKRYNKN